MGGGDAVMTTDQADGASLEALAERANHQLKRGDAAAALAICCRILERDIGYAPAYHAAGTALELMGNETAAMASHQHAAQIDPAYAAPLAAMALLAVQQRNVPAARALADRALALDARQPVAALALARLAVQDARPGEAVALLGAQAGPAGLEGPPSQAAMAWRVLGDALDALRRPDQAFDAYAASAAIFRAQFAASCAGPLPLAGVDLCHRLADGYRDAGPDLWTPAPAGADASGGAAGHVFVVGFPRSGTTLLEQVLASHPDVVALEEQATLTPAIDAYLDPPDRLDDMARMDEAAADRWRRDYWERVRRFGVDPTGKVFVDKQPFYTLWLPLIGKLFPDARIVVARRDPRDVVLSCFRRPFRMTPVTYELMDLERSAHLYAGAMDILETFLERSPNPRFIYRHEDLVADFDAVSNQLCAFLGLTWSERLRDFAATARTRHIRTPSALQVVRGLNRDGIGAWRPYAGALRPIMATLQPWVDAYGYPA
jgi:tetratricopeptide (TPR) repeat protein